MVPTLYSKPRQLSLEERLEFLSRIAFGPKAVRKRRTRKYIFQLVSRHGESLVREILAALGTVVPYSGDPPDWKTARLEDFLRPYDFPVFKLTVRIANGQIIVDADRNGDGASHWAGSRHILVQTPSGLAVIGDQLREFPE